MASRHAQLTPGLKRALEAWFAEHPEHLHEMAPFRKVIEERERNASEEAMIRAKREDLSLLLESKFGQLPDALVLKLETLRHVDELDRLYKRALHAQTLGDVGNP